MLGVPSLRTKGDGKGPNVGFHTAVRGASYKNMFVEWENIHVHVFLLVLPALLHPPSHSNKVLKY